MLQLAAVFLAALLALAPWKTTESVIDQARWSGCKADVVTSSNHSVLESHYRSDIHTLYIGTAQTTEDGEAVPDVVGTMIVFHEIAHCLQDQEGVFDTLILDPLAEPMSLLEFRVRVELDADRRSADLACDRGEDGRGQLKAVFLWAKEKYNYDGDMYHGTLEERISQGDKATHCIAPRSPEAP